MGDQPRSLRSSGLPLLLRLLSVVAALAVLCVSGKASAAAMRPADQHQPVPMCSDRGESIAAPPIFRAYEPGTLIASPCQTPDALRLGESVPFAPERVVIHERSERVLGFGALCVMQTESTLATIDAAQTQLTRAAFVGSLFRPPRA